MLQAKPRWSWTGVEELVFSDQDSRLVDLVALLPAQQSTNEQIVAYFIDLRARFQRWLHQDEFGPDRSQQTAALRALMRSFQSLQKQLIKGSSHLKDELNAILRNRNDPPSEVLQALYESAADLERGLRITGAPNRDITWASRLQERVDTLSAQSQLLDTNTDGKVFLTALRRKFDLSQTTGLDFGLADVESWLIGYWDILAKTLDELNGRRGAEERVSLKLLIEQLCKLWERETGCRVTAHGQVKDEYTRQAETAAGRFVTAAVEAMLPDQSWFEEHAEFAHSVRAQTFSPNHQRARALQILVIMRDFVRRRQSNT
jgi:hypothetical protein